jgi:hypothetical protein
MNNMLKIDKIYSGFHSWRVADAHVVGGKNTNNGWNIRVDFYPPNHPQHAGKVSTAYPTNVTSKN